MCDTFILCVTIAPYSFLSTSSISCVSLLMMSS